MYFLVHVFCRWWTWSAAQSASGTGVDAVQAEVDPGKAFLESLNNKFIKAQGRTNITIQDNEGKTEINPWVRRTGWATHFAGCDPMLIRAMASTNIEDGWGHQGCPTEKAWLEHAYESLDRVTKASKDACMPDNVGEQVLFAIGRKVFDTKPNTPFHVLIQDKMMKVYTTIWRRILGYIFRTMRLDEDTRPPYVFDDEEEEKFNQLQDLLRQTSPSSAQADLDKLDRTMLDFLVALLKRDLSIGTYDSALLSGLAALGIREDGGWVEPQHYTPYYSATIKLARMFVVWQSELEAEEQGDDTLIYSIVCQKVGEFMTMVHDGENPRPMDWIFSARTYGRKIAMTTASAGHITWSGSSLSYKSVNCTTGTLIEMMHSLVAEMGRTMDELTFVRHGVQLTYLEADELSDDLGNTTVGWSFLQDPRNERFRELQRSLFEEVMKIPSLQKEFIRSENSGGFSVSTKRMNKYQQLVDEFKRLLLIAVHLLAGQPARSTELLCIRWQNTTYGGIRNVFIYHKMVCLVTSYHKGYMLYARTKIIHRYLPAQLGKLLVQYLSVVLPFAQQLQLVDNENWEISPFLWDTGVVRAPMARRHESGVTKLWSSDKMRLALQDLTSRYLGTSINIANWRHIAIAIARRYLSKHFHPDDLRDSCANSDTEDEDAMDNILDLQAAHTTWVAQITYARETEQGQFGSNVREDDFRRASKAWHAFFGFHSSSTTSVRPAKMDQYSTMQFGARQARLKRLQALNLLGTLKQFVGDKTATFRGNQEQAISAVVQGWTPILQVSGTGVGKTMIFMLPAYAAAQDSTTVVVVPFIALQEDIQRRCHASSVTAWLRASES